jgi:hypothetical protein
MRVIFLLIGAAVAGCSSGGDEPAPTPPAASAPPSPVVTQSSGGIWHGIPGANESMTLYIAETGELIVQAITMSTTGGTPPALRFGTGAVIVNSPNDVAGTFRLRLVIPSSFAPVAGVGEQDCAMDGTVTERSLLQTVISCTDTAGDTVDQNVNFIYNPAYELDSSLAAIAGNYTIPFRPLTNTLNINASGVVFGMLDNGPKCTVNGQVEVIDARFNLYRFEIQLSLCQAPFGQPYEGATLRGFGARNLPGMPADAFVMLLSGNIPGAPIQVFSLLYERV